MSNYKVGDLASLMSSSTAQKPGGKLQSLFDEHYKRKPNPNAAKKANKMKTEQTGSPSKCDVESNTSKKMKKKKFNQNSSTISSPTSLIKKTETDFNSDFLPIHNGKKQFREKNSSVKRKRNNSFSENSAIENKKQSVEPSKNVTTFIRCSKNKREKMAEQGSVGTKPDIVKENLFSEIEDTKIMFNSQSKKQKNKKKSKESYQNSSNSPSFVDTDGDEDESAETGTVKNMADAENQSKKQKNKKKSKQPYQISSNSLSFVDTDEEDDESAETGTEKSKAGVKKSKADEEKIRLQSLKDLPCTLFVGNLPVSMNRRMLQRLFSSFGPIKSARLRGAVSTKLSIPKKVAEIKSEYHKGLQSHTGFVVFRDEQSAKDALSLNGTLIENHHIVVDFANQAGGKKLYDNDLSVFLGNLPFDVDDETVRSALEECGEIHAVRIIRDKDTGLGKGFGYIQFQEIKSKEKALSLEDLEINGRRIRIKPIESDQRKKAGPKKTVMMIRKNMAVRREKGNKKSVKKLLKKGKQIHKKKQIARLLGEKFVK